jgi:drug/metabolite transporter (DMT)-like permease
MLKLGHHPTLVQRLAIPLMLLSGTCSTLVQKFMREQSTSGRDIYPVHPFAKPWFLMLVMFIAEVLALIFYQISQRLQRAKSGPMYSNLVAGDNAPIPKAAASRRRLFLLLGLSALCDLVGSAVMGIGLLSIDASVCQMLRGALTIFSALLHAFVLKRPQKWHNWIGVMMSLILVGFAAVTAS